MISFSSIHPRFMALFVVGFLCLYTAEIKLTHAQDNPESSNFPETIIVKNVRGWAYIYQDYERSPNSGRKALEKGEPIPLAKDIVVSPNSRITLSLGEIASIGVFGPSHIRFDQITSSRSTYQIDVRLESGSKWFKVNSQELGYRSFIYRVNLIRTVLKEDVTIYFESGKKTGAVDITYVEGPDRLSFWRASNERYFISSGDFLPVSPDTTQPEIKTNPKLPVIKSKLSAWDNWQPEPLAMKLDYFIPPLELYAPYGTLPALHPYKIPIDHTMLLPPETRSMGEILELYKKGLREYKKDTGNFPTKDQGLDVLIAQDRTLGWNGPYVPLSIPRRDLWGSKFVYEVIVDGEKKYPDVRSMGPNQKDDKGLEDDIR